VEKQKQPIADTATVRQFISVTDAMVLLNTNKGPATKDLENIAKHAGFKLDRIGWSTNVSITLFCQLHNLDELAVRQILPRFPWTHKVALSIIKGETDPQGLRHLLRSSNNGHYYASKAHGNSADTPAA
jgi:hypothetical protein